MRAKCHDPPAIAFHASDFHDYSSLYLMRDGVLLRLLGRGSVHGDYSPRAAYAV